MENYVFDDDVDAQEQLLEQSEETPEDGFMEGYSEEEEVTECAECGVAIPKEKKVMKAVEEDEYAFCSKECAQEFIESLE